MVWRSKGKFAIPFRTINVSEDIELLRKMDPDFKKAWDESRTEYQQIGEMISLRKKKNLRPKNKKELSARKWSGVFAFTLSCPKNVAMLMS